MAKKKEEKIEFLTVEQAAEIACVTPATIRNWCFQLKIGKKIGGRWKVNSAYLSKVTDGDLHYGKG
jgi:hypothetical protein